MYNAIHLYRAARWLYLHHIPLLPKLLQAIIFCCYACRVPFQAKIGKGTYLSHGGIGVTISPKSTIGEHCVLGFRCSIIGQAPYLKTPQIGNHVFISPGAIIQGAVIVEDHVIIGANAVVTKSVPAYAIVAGIPAKIIGDVRDLDYDIFSGDTSNTSTQPFLTPKPRRQSEETK